MRRVCFASGKPWVQFIWSFMKSELNIWGLHKGMQGKVRLAYVPHLCSERCCNSLSFRSGEIGSCRSIKRKKIHAMCVPAILDADEEDR